MADDHGLGDACNGTPEHFPVDELARLLAAGGPAVVTRLRADHIPGDDGRCRACWSARAAPPLWPCTLAALADRAAQLGRR